MLPPHKLQTWVLQIDSTLNNTRLEKLRVRLKVVNMRQITGHQIKFCQTFR